MQQIDGKKSVSTMIMQFNYMVNHIVPKTLQSNSISLDFNKFHLFLTTTLLAIRHPKFYLTMKCLVVSLFSLDLENCFNYLTHTTNKKIRHNHTKKLPICKK